MRRLLQVPPSPLLSLSVPPRAPEGCLAKPTWPLSTCAAQMPGSVPDWGQAWAPARLTLNCAWPLQYEVLVKVSVQVCKALHGDRVAMRRDGGSAPCNRLGLDTPMTVLNPEKL